MVKRQKARLYDLRNYLRDLKKNIPRGITRLHDLRVVKRQETRLYDLKTEKRRLIATKIDRLSL